MKEMFCCVPVSPMRAEPSHRSEMVSQQLFGERCVLLQEEHKEFARIRCTYDQYEGWVTKSHLALLKNKDIISLKNNYTADWVNKLKYKGRDMMVPAGCPIELTAGDNDTLYEGRLFDILEAQNKEEVLQKVALQYLNTAYLWGGKSVFGIDCSGFAQMVFRFLGVSLPRDSSLQSQEGQQVDFVQEARCGDLAFFDNEEGRINHVGVLLSGHEIIHASGKVRVDKIDQHGIMNVETGQRTHTLRIIRRFF